jgi:hypothetical protein
MSEQFRHELMMDRRVFLSSVGIAAGASLAASMLPLSVASAVEANVSAAATADGLWSVDVICGHWPLYSHPIPYGRMQPSEPVQQSDLAPTLEELLVA